MNRFKMLNFIFTFISSIFTLLELVLTLVFKNYIAINLFLAQISGFVSFIIFIDELSEYNILKQLESGNLLLEKYISIEILIVVLIFIIFLGVPIILK